MFKHGKIFLLTALFSVLSLAQNSTRVISSDKNSLYFEFTPVYTDTARVNINGTQYRKGDFTFAADYGLEPGSPMERNMIIPVGVPGEFNSNLQVVGTEYFEVKGRLIPTPEYSGSVDQPVIKYVENEDYKSSNREKQLVEFGDFFIVRGMPVQNLVINPVQYFPERNTIRYYTKVSVRVNFRGGETGYVKHNDLMLKQAVLNYAAASGWIKKKTGLQKSNSIRNSVLAEGIWYRFECKDEGFYRIGYSQLSNYGIDAASVDPRTIKIYNRGGLPLPQSLDLPQPEGLEEMAIKVVGENDGKFDQGDYILFYGRGTEGFWIWDSVSSSVKRALNYYSDKNYYWITSGGANGKRITNKPGSNSTPDVIKTTTSAYLGHEEELVNIGQTGFNFVGEEFNSNTQERVFVNSLPGLISTEPVNYKYQLVNTSDNTASYWIFESNTEMTSNRIGGAGLYSHGTRVHGTVTAAAPLSNSRSVLKFVFKPVESTGIGYLDYYEIYYTRNLKAYNDDKVNFYSDKEEGLVEYRLSNFSNTDIKVFDVTDYNNVRQVSNPVMSSGGEYRFRVNESDLISRKYFSYCGENYLTPINPLKMSNQNLQGDAQGVQYVIITHPNFMEAANVLKTHKETDAPVPMSAAVYDINEIYNEFSYGMTDPTAVRNFLKYAYDNWQTTPEYLFLLGDASYDYRDIEGQGLNFVTAMQHPEFLNEIESYSYDDYFVRLDGNDWIIELPSGRAPVRSSTEAMNYVNKVIDYETGKDFGKWRSLLTFVADDGMKSSGPEGIAHTADIEQLIKYIIPEVFDKKKIYLAAYPDGKSTFGRSKPEVNEAIIDAINDGTLIMTYYGHGSPELWAHERVFVQGSTIPRLKNDKYFFLLAATCDFGYYDKLTGQSATEDLIVKSNSGSIAVFTAVRPVYAGENRTLAEDYYRRLLSASDTLNLSVSIGKAMLGSRLIHHSVNDIKYHIFGDPSIRLNIPGYNGRITSINGMDIDSTIQVKALSRMKIEGEIMNIDSSRWTGFNGTGQMTVLDSENRIHINNNNVNLFVDYPGGTIFNGAVSVINGKFSAEFVVPKDISYENNNGKIVFYFNDQNADGIAYSNNIIVGGSDTTVTDDGEGPEIEILFDDADYEGGMLVNPNSALVVRLEDETGINTTGTGIGHKIEGILDDNMINPIDLTDYFSGELDSGGKSGKVSYKFDDIKSGFHTIEVTAWDVFNNSASKTAEFKVVENGAFTVDYVMNYPNPFSDNTFFTFQHNFNGPVDVKISIYTVGGRRINRIERKWINERFAKIEWDGRDRDGDPIANGTYLYKLNVRTSDGKQSESVLGKLSVIR